MTGKSHAPLRLALRPDTLIATFGDLMRVPGPDGRSLKWAKAQGARIEIVYSPQDALALARAASDRTVVFLGVGFENHGSNRGRNHSCRPKSQPIEFYRSLPA